MSPGGGGEAVESGMGSLPQRDAAPQPVYSLIHFFHSADHPDHVFEWSLNDIFLLFCFSIPTLCLIFYVVKLLYRCCCSRNYAEWRSSWSQVLQSVFSRTYRRRRNMDPAKLFDAVPLKLNGHTEEIESVSSSLESPFVATHCIGGDVIVWDALSGECHTLIRRRSSLTANLSTGRTANRSSHMTGFEPHHRPTDSFSSDSTYSSSPSSSNSDTHFDVAFSSQTPDPHSGSHPHPAVTHANSVTAAVAPQPAVKNHRRHHSMSSISASSCQRTGTGSRSQQQAAYDFSAYFSRMNSSRELLTGLVRSACSTNSQLHKVAPSPANTSVDSQLTYRPIWTMEMFGKHVYIGCDNGRIEVWDVLSGSLSYFNDRSSSSSGSERSGENGVTAIRVNNTKMIVGYLDGVAETFHLQPQRHNLVPSSGRLDNSGGSSAISALYYTLCHVSRAHRQPITALEINSCYIMTGSLDHLVKVHSLDAGSHVYTLNGHCGGITSIEIDPMSPSTAVSGCQVGQVCVWDLQTGTCLFSLEAHRGASVSSILPTPHFIVTSGTDDKVFIWDKQSGNLVHSINQVNFISALSFPLCVFVPHLTFIALFIATATCNPLTLSILQFLISFSGCFLVLYRCLQSHSMCKQMLLLSSNILVTACDDRLVLYNISDGREVRSVDISDSSRAPDRSSFHSNCMIKNLRLSSQSRAVVCDFGLQFCVIHFPCVADKYD